MSPEIKCREQMKKRLQDGNVGMTGLIGCAKMVKSTITKQKIGIYLIVVIHKEKICQ